MPSFENPPRPVKKDSKSSYTELKPSNENYSHSAENDNYEQAVEVIEDGFTPDTLADIVLDAEAEIPEGSSYKIKPLTSPTPEQSYVLDQINTFKTEEFRDHGNAESKKEYREHLRSLISEYRELTNTPSKRGKRTYEIQESASGIPKTETTTNEAAPEQSFSTGKAYRFTDLDANNKKLDSQIVKKERESDTVLHSAELSKLAGLEQEQHAMREAQKDYLEAYKLYHSKRSLLSLDKESESLQQLRSNYQKAQLAYSDKMMLSVKTRLESRPDDEMRAKYDKSVKEGLFGVKDGKGRALPFELYKEHEIAKTLERYKGIVRFNEVIKPGLDEQNKARLEAISTKKEGAAGAFLKGVGWLARKNHAITNTLENQFTTLLEGKKVFGKEISPEQLHHIAKFGARATRLLITSAAFTTVGMMTGGLGFAAAGLYSGQRIARGLTSILVGSAAGYAAGKSYEQTGGRLAQEKHERSRREDITSTSDIQKQTHDYRHGSVEAIERKRRAVETAAMLLTSFGMSADQAHAAASDPALHHAVHALDKATHPSVDHSHASVGILDSKAHPHPMQEFTEVNVEAHHGEGAYKLFKDLQQKLEHDGNRSELAQYLIHANPKKFMDTLHVINAEGHSVRIPEGAKLSLSDHGQLVFHGGHGHDGTVLLEKNTHGDWEMKGATFEKMGLRFDPPHHHIHHAPAAHEHAATTSASSEAVASGASDPTVQIEAHEVAHQGYPQDWDTDPEKLKTIENDTYDQTYGQGTSTTPLHEARTFGAHSSYASSDTAPLSATATPEASLPSLQDIATPHFFASATGAPYLNSHNVDLSKPSVLGYKGLPIAHGQTSEASYQMATKLSQELLASGAKENHVLFVAMDPDEKGVLHPILKSVQAIAANRVPIPEPVVDPRLTLPNDNDYVSFTSQTT